MTKFFFSKMHGLGNDFLVTDNIAQTLPNFSKKIIAKLADRNFGVGFDQMLIIEKSDTTNIDFNYRILNADGSEVGQCGNGARCLARYISMRGLSNKKNLKVKTLSETFSLQMLSEDTCLVNMPKPILQPQKVPSSFNQISQSYEVFGRQVGILSMGNPHCILVEDDVENINITSLAKKIQNSKFFPQSVNVSFMQIIDTNNIRLRVYERGVGESLACGSGACASVVYGILIGLLNQKVSVKLNGGDLDISWSGNLDNGVQMIGKASYVFDGQIGLLNFNETTNN